MHLSFRRIASSDVRLSLTRHRCATLRLNSTSSPPPDPAELLTRPQLKTLVLSRYTKSGKFSGLTRHVLASPSILLTACRNLAAPSPPDAAPLPPPPPPSLLELALRRFSLSKMGREIAKGQFDVAACCVTMAPSRKKGEPLVLPGLKLVTTSFFPSGGKGRGFRGICLKRRTDGPRLGAGSPKPIPRATLDFEF